MTGRLRALPALPVPALVPVPLRVTHVARETADTVTLRLDAAPLAGGFRFSPGQFNMLYVFGVGEVPISVAGDPAEPGEIVHTVRAVGAVTRAIAAVRRGATLGVRGPFGSAWPLERMHGCDVIVIAGGLGLAALTSAVDAVLARRAELGRITVLYGARTPGDLLYRKAPARWRRLGAAVEVTVDRAGLDWRGHVGVAPGLLARVPIDPARTVAMLCGPEVMMRFAVRALEGRGLPREAIWLSLERNMKCAVGSCGHCQLVPFFVCKDGPVFRYDRVAPFMTRREL
jgi:NAD(P)H-flavin reductase